MLVFKADYLAEAGKRIFQAAGAPEDIAAHVATSLVESNLVGHDSHGVIRIPTYVARAREGLYDVAGRPETLRETATTAVVTGNWGFGQIAATYATDLAIRKAREHDLGAVGVVQCNHIGRLGEYAHRGALQGFVVMVTAGGFPGGAQAPFGGAGRALGTNPFAFGVPGQSSQPMVVDFATTIVAEGKLQVARAKHEPVPQGWILDKEGRPSTNVEDFYAGGTLLPFGAHKGYGLAMVAEILSSTLSGLTEYRGQRGGHGTFVLALNPTAFRTYVDFTGENDALFRKVKNVPTAAGFSEVMIPGEPEMRARAKRLVDGIPVAEDTWAKLQSTADQLGAVMP